MDKTYSVVGNYSLANNFYFSEMSTTIVTLYNNLYSNLKNIRSCGLANNL